MNNKNAKMTVTQLTILTALSMMGSGIIMLPTKLAEVGTFSIVSWLVTATGSTALAYAFAKCGMLSRKSGGMGGYAEYAFGKSGSFLANVMYAFSLVIANIAMAISAVGYATVLFDVQTTPLQTGLMTIALLWLCSIVNFRGARLTGMLSNVTAWCTIIPVAFLSIAGWFWFRPELYLASWNPNHLPTFDAISSSITMTLWAFLGLEAACVNADAIENPEKNIPKAVLGATISVALIYILSTNMIAGIVDNASLVQSTAPFGLVYSMMFNDTVGVIVTGMMILACVGSLMSWQFTIARVFKLSADEGYFPRWFGQVSASGTPLLGLILITILQSILSFATISPSLYRQFNVLVDLAVVTNLVPYLLSMGAVATILKVEKVTGRTATITLIAAGIGFLYSVYATYASGLNATLFGLIACVVTWIFYQTTVTRFAYRKA